jgi:hypothetical protein
MLDRSLCLLLCFALLISGASWWFIDARYQTSAAWQAPDKALVFPRLQHRLNDITDIEVARAGGNFVLSKRNGAWINDGLGGFPARPIKVEKAIVAIASLKYKEAKTKRPRLHTQLDVEAISASAKSTRLILKDSTNNIAADLIIGKKQKILGRQGLYIRLANAEQAWLVANAVNNEAVDVRYDAIDWSNSNVFDIAPSELTALSVRQASGDIVALYRAQPQAIKLTLKNLPANASIEHQFQIDYMSGLLNELKFIDAKPYFSTLQNSLPTIIVEAKTQYGSVIIIKVYEHLDDGSVWTRVKAKVNSAATDSSKAQLEVARIRSAFNDWSIRLPRKFTDRLKINLSDILNENGANNNE